jgi:hypothetical protein
MSIFVALNHAEHRIRDLRGVPFRRSWEPEVSDLAVVLFTIAIVLIAAFLAAAVAGKVARLDGATYPAALLRAATAFATVLTLAAAVTTALADVLG